MFFLRGGRGLRTFEHQGVSIVNRPVDIFGFLEVHGLSQSGGEVDVPLFAGLAFDELHFSREWHISE